ncbi:unnamed protein product [Lampetra planeri]
MNRSWAAETFTDAHATLTSVSSPVTGDAAATRSMLSGVEEEEVVSVSRGGGGRICAPYPMDGAAAPTEGKGHHAFGDAYLDRPCSISADSDDDNDDDDDDVDGADRLMEIIARHLEVEPHHGVLCEPYEPHVARALVGLGCLHSPPRPWGPGETGAARGATRGPDRALVMMLDTGGGQEVGSLQLDWPRCSLIACTLASCATDDNNDAANHDDDDDDDDNNDAANHDDDDDEDDDDSNDAAAADHDDGDHDDDGVNGDDGKAAVLASPPQSPSEATLVRVLSSLPAGGRLVVVRRPHGVCSLPLFSAARRRLHAPEEASCTKIISCLKDVGADVEWDVARIPITVSKSGWLGVLRGRRLGLLSAMSDRDIREGIRELCEGCLKYSVSSREKRCVHIRTRCKFAQGDTLAFEDLVMFITATRRAAHEATHHPHVQRRGSGLHPAPSPCEPQHSRAFLHAPSA